MEHQRHAALNFIKSILIEHKAVNRVDLTSEKLRLDTKKVIYVVRGGLPRSTIKSVLVHLFSV